MINRNSFFKIETIFFLSYFVFAVVVVIMGGGAHEVLGEESSRNALPSPNYALPPRPSPRPRHVRSRCLGQPDSPNDILLGAGLLTWRVFTLG